MKNILIINTNKGDKMKIKEAYDLDTVFGDLKERVIWSNNPLLSVGDIVLITNSNCEFDYDSIDWAFVENPIYTFVVNLELIDTDFSNYEVEKSNNGGKYAFASCRVLEIIEGGY